MVGVVLVVGDVVCVDVPDVVCDDVAELVTLEVTLVVTVEVWLDVTDDVGVVISHSRNVPSTYELIMLLNVSLVAPQSLLSVIKFEKHAIFSVRPSAGPVYSKMMSFKASAVSEHDEPLESSQAKNRSDPSATHFSKPVAKGHAAKILLSQFLLALQLSPPKNFASYLETHVSSPSNGVVVADVVCVLLKEVVAEVVAVVLVVNDVVPVLVTDEVGDVVPVNVAVVVCDDDAVVVALDVTVVVCELVGVVTSQSWKLPLLNASNIVLIVAAASSQLLESTKYLPKAQAKFSSSPAGPRYSPMA